VESADHPAEEMSERRDHSKKLSGIIRIQLFAKSFILQVYEVLAMAPIYLIPDFTILSVCQTETSRVTFIPYTDLTRKLRDWLRFRNELD
jgi:hypothetical protein